MQLLTKQNLIDLPALYSQENVANPKAIVKFFNPTGMATWYAFEYSKKERLFFGYAILHAGCGEVGNFSLDELEALRLPMGLKIERDMHYTPELLSVIRARYN